MIEVEVSASVVLVKMKSMLGEMGRPDEAEPNSTPDDLIDIYPSSVLCVTCYRRL